MNPVGIYIPQMEITSSDMNQGKNPMLEGGKHDAITYSNAEALLHAASQGMTQSKR